MISAPIGWYWWQWIKVIVLDVAGNPQIRTSAFRKHRNPLHREIVIEATAQLAAIKVNLSAFWFPCVARSGVTWNAVNFDTRMDWFDLWHSAARTFGTASASSSEWCGYAGIRAISGQQLNWCTPGTGFGSALFVDGKLVPNLEMGHQVGFLQERLKSSS